MKGKCIKMSKEEHMKELQKYVNKIKPRIKKSALVKEPIETLETFSIEKHKVSLIQVSIDNTLKFGVAHSYDGSVGTLSYCDLYNKKEVATSLYNRICEDLKYKYKNLEPLKEQKDIEMEL